MVRPNRKWIGPAAWGAKEAKAGDRLPYARHLDQHMLRLRDGSLMRMIQVPGLPFETEDADALDHHLGVRETMLRSVLDARFVVYHHVIRRRVAVALDDGFDEPFAKLVNARWQARLDERRLFVNEQVVTLLRRPARGKTGWADRLRRKVAGSEAQTDPGEARALDAACVALLAALEPYGARALGFYDGAGDGQSLGRGGHRARDHRRDALLLQLPRQRWGAISATSPSSARRVRARRWCSIFWRRRPSASPRAPYCSTRIAVPKSSCARRAAPTAGCCRASRAGSIRCNCPTPRSTAPSCATGWA